MNDRVAKAAARPVKPADGLKAVELELLGKLSLLKKPVTIGELFDGFNPTWAVEAAHRLTAKGEVTRDRDGRYALTAAGWQRSSNGK